MEQQFYNILTKNPKVVDFIKSMPKEQYDMLPESIKDGFKKYVGENIMNQALGNILAIKKPDIIEPENKKWVFSYCLKTLLDDRKKYKSKISDMIMSIPKPKYYNYGYGIGQKFVPTYSYGIPEGQKVGIVKFKSYGDPLYSDHDSIYLSLDEHHKTGIYNHKDELSDDDTEYLTEDEYYSESEDSEDEYPTCNVEDITLIL